MRLGAFLYWVTVSATIADDLPINVPTCVSTIELRSRATAPPAPPVVPGRPTLDESVASLLATPSTASCGAVDSTWIGAATAPAACCHRVASPVSTCSKVGDDNYDAQWIRHASVHRAGTAGSAG